MVGAALTAAQAKDIALVSNKSNSVTEVSMSELVKICKGQTSRWPKGKPITLFSLNPASNEMRMVLEKVYGMSSDEVSALINTANHGRANHPAIIVVKSDKDLVEAVESTPGAAVYIDAGHDAWLPAADMADRLKKACIADATGFALNTSNYRATEDLIRYGHDISGRVGGKHFIIDTARNGNGPPRDAAGEAAWCNPDGRALGTPPTTNTGDPLMDAFFWVKPPGESDGTCNHGPRAGGWWPEYALGLAKRAKW